MMGDKSKIWLW